LERRVVHREQGLEGLADELVRAVARHAAPRGVGVDDFIGRRPLRHELRVGNFLLKRLVQSDRQSQLRSGRQADPRAAARRSARGGAERMPPSSGDVRRSRGHRRRRIAAVQARMQPGVPVRAGPAHGVRGRPARLRGRLWLTNQPQKVRRRVEYAVVDRHD